MALNVCDLQPRQIVERTLAGVPSALGLADLEGDGDLDLFVALASEGQIELFLNDGAGALNGGSVLDLGAPQAKIRLSSGDLDGDGDVDLVAARSDAGDLAIMFGQAGVFEQGPVLVATGSPVAVVAVDIDLDGAIDVMALNDAPEGVSVWFGDALGGFSAEKFTALAIDTASATIVDVYPDTVPDILSVTADRLRYFPGNLVGDWHLAVEYNLGCTGWSQALAADLDGTMPRELVVTRASDAGGHARIYHGAQDEEWQGVTLHSTVAPLHGGRSVDVTGDGIEDIVASTGTSSIVVLVGAPFYGLVCESAIDVGSDTTPELTAFGDVDGDDRIDIVAGSRDAPTVRVYALGDG